MTNRASLPAETRERSGWHARVIAIGRWRSVMVLTAFSVATSVALTGLGMHLLRVPDHALWQGHVLAVIVPAIVAPLATATITGLVFELEAMRSALQQLASRDSLTQAHNRRHFLEQLPIEVRRAQRNRQPLSQLMLDADHFKQVNDQHGHASGDEVLVGIADVCRSALRPYDVLSRYGGEEFMLLLNGLGIDQALEVAERLRASIAAMPMHSVAGVELKVTVSIGVAELSVDAAADPDGRRLLERADSALYRAKRAGRNCCMA